MQIIDIKTPDKINLNWKERLEEYCYLNINESTEPIKFLNYTSKGLDIENHLYFSAMYDEDNLVCFCGIYNGGRYPSHMHRIQNRTYVAPEYRHNRFSIKPHFYSIDVTNHQFENWKNPGVVFMSIQEKKRSPRMLKFITSMIKPKPTTDWQNLEGYAQVVAGNRKECYQKAIYANYSIDNSYSFSLPTISEIEYEKLFEEKNSANNFFDSSMS